MVERVDDIMERASEALASASYIACESLCVKALARARAAGDFDTMARVCLPLQESRRQLRHAAVDSGLCFVQTSLPRKGSDLTPGMYLAQPPMIGIEARRLREKAHAAGVPVLVVCREPMTQAGLWPIVAVGEGGLMDTVSYRVRIRPPEGVVPAETGITKDVMASPPDAAWMLAASEALGDAAIASVDPAAPAAWRADDLLFALGAIPDHEKLHQRLADACREAAAEPPIAPRSRRPRHDDPTGF
ncbi:MAG: hypothetical protein HRU70_03855 [Phycisphaeraceae bacterium]|nr:MAG: hypothetical protein HRU70_03855 [Phycisphaeraceae bacterium]